MNEMEEDREILVNRLDQKEEDLKTSHAKDARHQRELAHVKRFREAELDETLQTFFGGDDANAAARARERLQLAQLPARAGDAPARRQLPG